MNQERKDPLHDSGSHPPPHLDESGQHLRAVQIVQSSPNEGEH